MLLDSVVSFYLQTIVDRLNTGLRDAGHEPLSENGKEMYGLLQMIVLCHFYDASPSVLTGSNLLFHQPVLSKQRFKEMNMR